MDSVYQLQFPIFHAKLLMIALWSIYYILLVWSLSLSLFIKRLRKLRTVTILAPLNLIALFYTFFMLKGVSIKFNDLIINVSP